MSISWLRRYPYRAGALCLAICTLLAVLVFPGSVAIALVKVGDAFFEGPMPYSLSVAEGMYQAALLIDREVQGAWHQRARIAFLDGRLLEAEARINEQIRIFGTTTMPSYYVRGLIYGYMKKYEEAERDFLSFLAWKPKSWAANNDLAWIYFAQGKFAQAQVQARAGLAANPENPWLLLMHGMALHNLGRSDEARQELQKASETAARLSGEDWGRAYPGNDPKYESQGLSALKETIRKNLELVHK